MKKRTIYDINLHCLECKIFCKQSKNIDVEECKEFKAKDKKTSEQSSTLFGGYGHKISALQFYEDK